MGTWVMPPDPDTSDLNGLLNCGAKYGTTSTCTFQAFILQFGGTSSVLFSTCLAILFLLLTREHWTEAQVRRVEKGLQIGSWILSLLSAFVFIPFDLYHPAGSICYLSEKILLCDPLDNNNCWYEYSGNEGHFANILLEHIPIVYVAFIPVCACVLVNIAIVGFIYQHMRRIEAKVQAKLQRQQQQVVSSQESLTDKLTMFDQSSKRNGQPPSSNIGDVIPTPPATVAELIHTPDGEENEASDNTNDDDDDYAVDGEHTEHSMVTTESQEQRRSIVMAKQGLWYIVGFLGTFGLTFCSGFVFLATGESNETLDYFSYFFLASLGLWNFFIFSRRRKMKTSVGRMARALVWDQVFGAVPLCRMVLRCWSHCPSFSKDRNNAPEENDELGTAPTRPTNYDMNPNFTRLRQTNLRGGGLINHPWFQHGDQNPSENLHKGKSERPSQYNSKVSWKDSLVSELGASAAIDVDFGGTRFMGHVGNKEQQDQSPAKPKRFHSNANSMSVLSEGDSSSEEENTPEENQQQPPTESDSPPAWPIQSKSSSLILFEVSDYSSCFTSIGENPENALLPSSSLGASNHSCAPVMPRRIGSEIEEQPPNSCSNSNDDAPVSRLSTNLGASNHSCPPVMPLRIASEIEEQVLQPPNRCFTSNEDAPEKVLQLSSNLGASSHSCPPVMPRRIASEIEEQTLEPPNNLKARNHSCPPVMPRRLATEVDEFEEFDT